MTQTVAPVEPGRDAPISLHVVESRSSRSVELPRDGELIIGRAHTDHLHIDSAAVSRSHARITIAQGEVKITDLESRNGTLVNGEPVPGSKSLASGDRITIGDATLVLHAPAHSHGRQVLDIAQLRARLEDELDRAAEYSSTFALAVIRTGTNQNRTSRGRAALNVLRRMDLLAVDGESLVALLPELAGEAARAAVASLLEAVKQWSCDGRAGVATFPADGRDADTLLAAARSAAAAAEPDAVCVASEATVIHRIDQRSIVVADPAMMATYELLRRLAGSDISVLILGETGTGKENAAAALHEWSRRAGRPFIPLNCSALPDTLVESELFGYERGAFSEARQAKPGLLERAHGGTVFLDEVGDLAPSVQAKLLRVLEQRRITRLGDVREREVDIRIVAATNRNVHADVKKQLFRADLLHRLGAATVELPPLRLRRGEIPLLARLFVKNACEANQRPGLQLAEATLALLASYSFPGNVRELRNIIDRAVVVADGPLIQPWDLPKEVVGDMAGKPSERADGSTGPERRPPAARSFRPVAEEVRELEKTRMIEALEACGGVHTRAAAAIGMPIRTFTNKVKQYGIARREPKQP